MARTFTIVCGLAAIGFIVRLITMALLARDYPIVGEIQSVAARGGTPANTPNDVRAGTPVYAPISLTYAPPPTAPPTQTPSPATPTPRPHTATPVPTAPGPATAVPTPNSATPPPTGGTAIPIASPTPTPPPAPPTVPPPIPPLAPEPASTQADPTPTAYTVRGGDSVTTIAARFGVTPAALIAANNLTGPQWIRVGQVLRIP